MGEFPRRWTPSHDVTPARCIALPKWSATQNRELPKKKNGVKTVEIKHEVHKSDVNYERERALRRIFGDAMMDSFDGRCTSNGSFQGAPQSYF